MKFIPQTKARDYSGQELTGDWYYSVKVDGVYTQIHVADGKMTVFSSSGREIAILDTLLPDGVYEAEFAHESLVGRKEADSALKHLAKTGEIRENFGFYIFDIISDDIFSNRMTKLNSLPTDGQVDVLVYRPVGQDVKEWMVLEVKHGMEGIVIKSGSHTHTGKKTNLSYKVKPVKTADLKIVEKNKGYLYLEDENGVTAKVRVNSGVFDFAQVGQIVEIKYDRIVNRYDQAAFVDMRIDKESL